MRAMNIQNLNKALKNFFSNKIRTIAVIIIILVPIIAFSISPNFTVDDDICDSCEHHIASWTCLFYFDGDNNLADYNQMLTNLEFLERAGSNDEDNMVCLLDRNSNDD